MANTPFTRHIGRLAVDVWQFFRHVSGEEYRHKASAIDTDLVYTGLGNAHTVKEALDWLNSNGGGGGGGVSYPINLSTLSNTTGILPIIRGGTGLGTIGGSGTVFVSDGVNAAWQTIVNANINAAAGIVVSKLAGGSSNQVLITSGSTPTWSSIADANISNSANIAVSKLATGSANTVLTSNGTTSSWNQIVNANVASGAAIAVSKLAAGSTNQVLTTVGGIPIWAAAQTGSGSAVDLYGPTITGSVDGNGVLNTLTVDGYPAATIEINSNLEIRGMNGGTALTSRRIILKFNTGGSQIDAISSTIDLPDAQRINTSTLLTFTSGQSVEMYWGAGTGTGSPQRWNLVNYSVGEANTTSNSGAGIGLAQSKVGVNLPFKSLIAGPHITLTNNIDDITITSDGEANTTSNSGTGLGLAQAKSGVNLPFKTLLAGTNITLTNGTNEITISSAGGTGDITNASNLIGGTGWFASKSGSILQFKSIVITQPLASGSNANTITVSVAGLSGFGAVGQSMRVAASGTAMEWYTPSSGGGSPAGTTGEPQINGGGVFAVPGSMTMGNGFISIGGGTVATTGRMRVSTTSSPFIAQRNSTNTGDVVVLDGDGQSLYLGSNSSLSSRYGFTNINATTTVSLQINSGTGFLNLTSNSGNGIPSLMHNIPSLGASSPYSTDGVAVVDAPLSTTTLTLNVAQYSRKIIRITGSWGTPRVLVLPGVSTQDQSYEKTIVRGDFGATSSITVQSSSGGNTLIFPGDANVIAYIMVTPEGISGSWFTDDGRFGVVYP